MAGAKVSFGDLNNYAEGGFDIPEGDYAVVHTVQMFAGTKADGTKAGPERLGVMLDFYNLATDKDGNYIDLKPTQKFLSMGSKADQSFAPDPETGKGIVPVAGGSGASMNNKTNWFLYLKSLYDCGLPVGVLDNDLTTIDGIHLHIQSVPEPEDRKGFGSKTGEVEQERRVGKVPVATEIKDDGKPWEGTGGIPEAGAVPAVKAPAVAAPKTKAGPKPVPAKAAAPVAVVAAEDDDELLKATALTAMASVLEANPKGCAKVVLRTGTFKAIKDEAMGNRVLETFFADEATLNLLIGALGYTASGMMVKPT